jgi:hypothetical protein
MDCTAKEHLEALVHALTLAICLGMACCRKLQLGAQVLEQLLPEVASEDAVTIRDNGPRHAMEFHH